MKHWKALILCIFLVNCAYNPKVDTAGRSGTFDKSRAEHLSNDLVICKEITDKNVNYYVEGAAVVNNWILRPVSLFVIPKIEYKEKKIYDDCLYGRGHSVLGR
tara:strand:+ start:1426 stop:1734 length:309 start_codon:yes stop_codon:yes gene_type:complete